MQVFSLSNIAKASDDGKVVVPYHFIGEEPADWKSAIADFTEKTCIRFVSRPPAMRGEVSIYTSGRGCGAKVGWFADSVTPVVLNKKACWKKGKKEGFVIAFRGGFFDILSSPLTFRFYYCTLSCRNHPA